jgi:hypothetical protein
MWDGDVWEHFYSVLSPPCGMEEAFVISPRKSYSFLLVPSPLRGMETKLA